MQTATTLDVLAKGRAMFGIGAAWYEREHHAWRPLPVLGERFSASRRRCRSRSRCGRATTALPGQVVSARRDGLPPGTGARPDADHDRRRRRRKTLRLVAQYADVWNANTPVEEIAHKLDVLKTHCETLGRDFSTIRISAQAGTNDPVADPEGFLEWAGQLARLGVHHVQVRNPTADVVDWAERVGAGHPALAEL